MSKVEYHVCDISNCENHAEYIGENHNVIFHTEQTEGRPCEPYFEASKLDLCKDHMGDLILGETVHAHGAQGCNTYYIPTPKPEQYWKERCLLAEKYIELSPCDPDTHDDQLIAYREWMDFKNEE